MERLRNIYTAYTTNQGFFWITFYGVMLIISGLFNIKVLIKIFTMWTPWFVSHNVDRVLLILFGLMVVVTMVMTASQG